MNLGRIWDFIAEKNIEPQDILELVEEVKKIDTSDEENLRRDFRKFMFAKFGAEYLAEFKNYISTQRANEIKEQTEEINSKYDSELEMLP